MRIITIISLIVAALTTASCKKWLDVMPENQPTEDQLLASPDGYRSVLNGLYRTMGHADLYGRELTFGLLDCISQQYKLDIGQNVTNSTKYIAAGKFEYDNPGVKLMIEDAWRRAFNVVANANSIIQNIQVEDNDFFAYGEMEKNLILGEAYACRALMHFDMLRLFAPPPSQDDGKNYVPYVETYPNTVPVPIGSSTVLNKVVADLEKGRALVAGWDTSSMGIGTLITGEARFRNQFNYGTEIYSIANQYDDFLKGRGYHLNYYAITALLARVENYRGEYQKAFDYAKEVMDLEIKDYYGMQKAFSLDKYTGLMSANWDAKNDLKTMSNLVFAVHNGKAYDELDLYTYFKREDYSGGTPTWFVINRDAQKTFETRDGADESTQDYRSVYMIYLANGLYPISGKYFLSTTETTRDNNAMIIPIIRSTEMRYIMAETYARQGNFLQAETILKDIRANRNANNPIHINSWNDFQEELIQDARREYISEGQLFYLYKRLNAIINFGQNVYRPLTRAEYLLPIPTINL